MTATGAEAGPPAASFQTFDICARPPRHNPAAMENLLKLRGSAVIASMVAALVMGTLPAALAQGPARVPAPAAAGGDDEYAVRPGETLNGISSRLLHDGETRRVQRALAQHNRLSDADRLRPGQVLRIPRAWLKSLPGTLEVASVQGDVRSGGQPLASGARLAAGDDVRSGANGYVTLKLADGSLLSLQPETEARIERAQASRATGTTDTRLQLERGRAEARVQRPAKGASRFEIRTPVATAAVRGTDFRVAVGEARDRSTSEVLAGEVGVSDAGGRIAVGVPAGFGTRVLTGQAPLAPRALLPAPRLWTGVRLVSRTPADLEFSEETGARSYRVLVAATETLGAVVSEQVLAAAVVRLGTLADGDYFVRVRAIDDIGLEGRDAVARVRVRSQADAPRPTSPPERSRIYGDSADFAWLADPGAAGYTLQLARDPAFRDLAAEWAGLREPRHRASGLAPGEYHWRVASAAVDGRLSQYSIARSLSLRPAPLPLREPRINDETLAVSWPGRPGQRFELQMAADAGFTRIVAEQTTGETAALLARPERGIYYLRVRATDPDGSVGPYTPARMVEVPARLPRPACLIEGHGGICATYAPTPR